MSHLKGYGEDHSVFTHDWQVRNVRIEIFAEAVRAEEIASAIVEAAYGLVVIQPVEKYFVSGLKPRLSRMRFRLF